MKNHYIKKTSHVDYLDSSMLTQVLENQNIPANWVEAVFPIEIYDLLLGFEVCVDSIEGIPFSEKTPPPLRILTERLSDSQYCNVDMNSDAFIVSCILNRPYRLHRDYDMRSLEIRMVKNIIVHFLSKTLGLKLSKNQPLPVITFDHFTPMGNETDSDEHLIDDPS